MNKRRSRIDIIHDILSAIGDKGGRIKPTHLLYKANLSHKLLKGYLEELVEKEFIKEVKENNNTYIIINDKGLNFVSEYKRFMDFEDTFGL